MTKPPIFIIRRQIYRGIHSSRRLETEYLYSQGGVWGPNRAMADHFTEANIDNNVTHFSVLNAKTGQCVGTARELIFS